jgi:hypothetical protein
MSVAVFGCMKDVEVLDLEYLNVFDKVAKP